MSGRLRQAHASLASGFGTLVEGCLNVWPSYTIQLYESDATPLQAPITQGEQSLLGGLPSLGAMVGTAIASTLINRLGRRNGGVALTLPYVICWTIISLTTNIKMVLLARFLAGIGAGGFMILTPIFISEVSEDSIRGALATSPLYMPCLGCVISYLMGWFLSYRNIIYLNMAISIFCTILLMLVVESPVYLLLQNRDEDARLSIAKYRGVPITSMVVADAFSRLKQQIMPSVELDSVQESEAKVELFEKETQNAATIVDPEEIHAMAPIKMLFVSPAPRKAFYIVLIVITNQVLMGVVPVQVFAKTVFMQADPDHADLYTVLFALVMFLGCIVTTLVTDFMGRRGLLVLSSLMVCVCMTALAILINDASPYITVFLLLLYCFSYMFGAGSVPFVLLTEMFAPEVQSIASMIIVEWVWFLNFLMIAVFPFMLDIFGIKGSFLMFAGMGLANAVIAYFIVPETKGLSNKQIQDLLVRKKK